MSPSHSLGDFPSAFEAKCIGGSPADHLPPGDRGNTPEPLTRPGGGQAGGSDCFKFDRMRHRGTRARGGFLHLHSRPLVQHQLQRRRLVPRGHVPGYVHVLGNESKRLVQRFQRLSVQAVHPR